MFYKLFLVIYYLSLEAFLLEKALTYYKFDLYSPRELVLNN
jgi:hypothetical protein